MRWQTRVAPIGAALWLTVAGATLLMVLFGVQARVRVVLVLLAALAVVMALRARRLGIEKIGSTLIVRGWFRTTSLDARDILAVEVVPYTGMIGGRDVDRQFRMVRLRRRAAPDVYVQTLMGHPSTLEALAVELKRSLDSQEAL